MYIHIHIYMYIYKHIYIYVYIYYTYACTYIYICIWAFLLCFDNRFYDHVRHVCLDTLLIFFIFEAATGACPPASIVTNNDKSYFLRLRFYSGRMHLVPGESCHK